MKIDLFDFTLPEHLIAQRPLAVRDQSRLLILNRNTDTIEHGQFTDLGKYLEAGDALVLNDTRVLPARLFGIKEKTGAHVELLLLKQLSDGSWEILAKPAKRLPVGSRIVFAEGLLTAVVEEITIAGGRIVRFVYEGIFNELLERLGEMPLPPYIKARLEEQERYQTVYSRELGSAAAPTAGLHFTEDYLRMLADKGVKLIYLTLHVGLGTFRPVNVEEIEAHEMHSEYYSLSTTNAELLNQVRASGKRVMAVGTTSARTLETLYDRRSGKYCGGSGWTDIFIYPGYQFAAIDCLLTNFHLPKSTLIMLVSALAGREKVMEAYKEAIANEYRFFSFGDAMLIV